MPGLKRLRPKYAGHFDGLVGGELHGWAWRPGAPDVRVEVEQWVDGELKGRTVADLMRADIQQAGVGDGAHAWRMPLALDPEKTTPQSVKLLIRHGGPFANGAFELTYEALPPAPQPQPQPQPQPLPLPLPLPLPQTQSEASAPPEPPTAPMIAWGLCDGRNANVVHGWAWRPMAPEDHVIVEQWVDGARVADTVADLPRADLHAAGIGDGRYGWSMELKLAPGKAQAQRIELRIRGAGILANGEFALAPAELLVDVPASVEAEAQTRVIGRCDGLKGAALFGWAWDPTRPDDPVEVELWIGGTCVERAVADGFRPDLRSNRVGTGRYGWRLPLDLRQAGPEPMDAEVRVKDGAPLDGGILTLKNDLSLDDPDNAALRPFVDAVLNAAKAPVPRPATAELTVLAHCPNPTEGGKYWAQEHHDYPAAMRAFMPALAALGEVVVLEDLKEADAICRARREEGRDCVLFVFGPPRRAPLGAPCPVVPVFAWAFPSIPTGTWDGDPRSDWRRVLQFTGRAVTFSRFAAQAVQAAMGSDYPVVAIPPPVRSRPGPQPPPEWRRTIRLNGVIFDSRDYVFDPEKTIMPTRVWPGDAAADGGRAVEIDGVLVTSFLELADKRANAWGLVSAFVTANRDRADATLLLKLSEASAEWMSDLYRWLASQPAFACRVLAVRGPLDGAAYDALVAASHWYATACTAEGLCLQLRNFQAGGRPAISPLHTALEDHLDADAALLVESDEEDWRWPMEVEDGGFSWTQHPDDVGPTTSRRISWPSLIGAFDEAYRLAVASPKDYARLSAAAAARARATGGAEATAAALNDMVTSGLSSSPRETAPGPSALIRELAAG